MYDFNIEYINQWRTVMSKNSKHILSEQKEKVKYPEVNWTKVHSVTKIQITADPPITDLLEPRPENDLAG